MTENDKYRNNYKNLELLIAHKMPCFEAKYGLSEVTPLSMYNCLIPRIKEHMSVTCDNTNNSTYRNV